METTSLRNVLNDLLQELKAEQADIHERQFNDKQYFNAKREACNFQHQQRLAEIFQRKLLRLVTPDNNIGYMTDYNGYSGQALICLQTGEYAWYQIEDLEIEINLLRVIATDFQRTFSGF